jgi:TonB-linked SusC/RagA family outer membrane protein
MKMKKLTLTFFLMLSMMSMALAQMKVSGKISDAAGEALVGASVVEKGTNNGVITDVDGNFAITVKEGSSLQVSMVGFTAQDVSVGGQSVINLTMAEGGALTELVVTALGITREKKALGYATQELKGADITAAPEVSAIQNLSGKIAGLTLTRGSYGPGSSTRVTIRGERSIVGDNQPLYVVDGVPLDNSSNGSGPAEFNGTDNGDGISNINPDDIETISVLKGPNAAALYGARANNGAIVITTKKGAAGRTSVSFSTNFSTESPSYVLKSQKLYGQGEAGKYAATDNSWGPKIDTGVFVYNGKSYKMEAQDHAGAFFNSGNTWNNNLAIASGNEKIQTRFSISNLTSNGIIPNNTLSRTNITLRGTVNLTSKLSLDAKVSYLIQEHKNRPAGGEEASNAYSDIVRMPTTVPLSSVKDSFERIVNGAPVQNFYVQNSIIGNPWWMVNKQQLLEKRNRLIGLVSAEYKLTPDLSFIGRVGLDKTADDFERKWYAGTPTQLTNNSAAGDYSTSFFNVQEFNIEGLARYTKKVTSDIGIGLTAGANLRKFERQSGFSASGGLDYLNLFTFNNAIRRNAGASSPGNKEVQSVYAMANFSFKDYLFIDVTGRNDWSSTLSAANRFYFYPSVSLSAVLSEMIALPDAISFAKLRASYAQVGNDTDPYQLQQYLNPVAGVVGTVLSNSSVRVIGDNLKPQQTAALEAGFELKFLKNRVGIDFSYYQTNTINQIISIPLKPSSGFNSQLINAGDIQNSGIELMLNLTPVKTTNFRWDMNLNFAKNTNKVIALNEGIENYGISSNRISKTTAKVGERLGELYVLGYQRDASGKVIVDTTRGLPVLTPGQDVYVGNINPDWTAGLNNVLTFKGFRLDFLFDYRSGGAVVSHTQAVLHGLGKAEATTVNRDGTDKDGKNYVVDGSIGVKDATSGKWSGSGTNAKAVTAESYWKFMGGRGTPVGEAFAYDATVLRLRQLSVSYVLPKTILGNSVVKGVTVGVYGRNLWFSAKAAPFDPEVALNSGLGGQGVDFYAPPSSRTIGVNLNVTF